MRGRRSILPLLVLLGLRTTARADTPPSIWDVAADPEERSSWNLHLRVERLLHPSLPDDLRPLDQRRDDELRLEAARAMLEQADAARSPDARLRFDLAAVYEQLATAQGRTDLHRRVVDILVPALEAFPDHPAVTGALETLVYAYAKLDRSTEELATWQRYVPRLRDDRARLAPMMNMGEAEMRLGRLDDATATFREALQLCEALPNSIAVNATYALTLWDLAVALDRAGDPRGAMQTAARAKSWSWASPAPNGQVHAVTGWDVIRDQREVFFVPEWEREWYLALGYAADAAGVADAGNARERGDAQLAATRWAAAEEHWATYVLRAESAGGEERWLAIARVRRDRAHAERLAAEHRAGKRAPQQDRSWVVE